MVDSILESYIFLFLLEVILTKVLIAADMEGVTGVVHWDDVTISHPEYTRFRRLMTGDVNAAIRGCCRAGAEEIIVSDGHAFGRNILIEEIDERARLNTGTPAPHSMVQGVANGVDGVMFVGYHARIGTPNAILEHTWSDSRVANFMIKGADDTDYHPLGEIGLNAAVCGHFGVPVIMISGDRAACEEARVTIGEIETAIIKWATGRMAAECLPPAISQLIIEQAAYQAISRLVASKIMGEAIKPMTISPPIDLAVDFVQSEMADKAAILPGARRIDRRVEYRSGDMLKAYEAFRSLLALAR